MCIYIKEFSTQVDSFELDLRMKKIRFKNEKIDIFYSIFLKSRFHVEVVEFKVKKQKNFTPLIH